jgi:uncharacterized protein
MNMEVQKNEAKQRFEVEMNGQLGILEYRMNGNSIIFTHAGVPPEIAGQGVASALTKAGLEYARAHRLRVVPQCPFVQGYLARHAEYIDLLD